MSDTIASRTLQQKGKKRKRKERKIRPESTVVVPIRGKRKEDRRIVDTATKEPVKGKKKRKKKKRKDLMPKRSLTLSIVLENAVRKKKQEKGKEKKKMEAAIRDLHTAL